MKQKAKAKSIFAETTIGGARVVAKWRTERSSKMATIVKYEKANSKTQEKQLMQVMAHRFVTEDEFANFVMQLLQDRTHIICIFF